MFSPTISHWVVLEKVSCNLKEDPGLDILYRDLKHIGTKCYGDATWSWSKIDKRCITSVCIFVGGNLIS